MIRIGNSWDSFFSIESKQDYYKELREFLRQEYKEHTVYPPMKDIFNAFKLTPIENVKVVIVGQDCYHEPNQAMGLAFSVPEDVKIPPSLRNIMREMVSDTGDSNLTSGDLTCWAKQGVLLLNTCLTVREHEANSHSGHGWELLTDDVIRYLNNCLICYQDIIKQDDNGYFKTKFSAVGKNCHEIPFLFKLNPNNRYCEEAFFQVENPTKHNEFSYSPMTKTITFAKCDRHEFNGSEEFFASYFYYSPKVFLLWGKSAREKKSLITNPAHLVLEAAHPSPLSAYHGFFGCKHFSKTNDFLIANGITPIKW
jgi:uracil-DNA glycosylase